MKLACLKSVIACIAGCFWAMSFCEAADRLDCKNALTQDVMTLCSKRAFDSANREMNRLYGDFRKRLDDTQKKKFAETQVAWAKYRELECKFESSASEGGSIWPMHVYNCMAWMAQSRIKELKNLVDCTDDSTDPSCPAFSVEKVD